MDLSLIRNSERIACDDKDELVAEILSNLPVKTLTRFKSVRKLWRDLISSEYFTNLHLNNFKTSVILVNSVSLDESESSISPVYPPSTPPPEASSRVDFTVPQPVNRTVGYDLCAQRVAACNGLICLWYHAKPDNIALWNPATKEFKIIPKSNLPRHSSALVNCTVVFGYDDVTNDYKIIQVLHGESCGDVFDEFELYSLSSGLWKKLDVRGVITEPNAVSSGYSTGCKIVCWLVFKRRATAVERRWELVLFDMSIERFEIVVVPVYASKNNWLELIPCEGSIGVMNIFSPEQVSVLNDVYSSASGGGGLRSWRKVNLPKHTGSAVAIFEDHMLFHDKTKRFTMYDRSCGSFDHVGFSKYKCVSTVTCYKESLVRLL